MPRPLALAKPLPLVPRAAPPPRPVPPLGAPRPADAIREPGAGGAENFDAGLEDVAGASGKSTQNAFMFSPYKKPAKFSLKRDRLSCSSCKCMKLASRSAMLSDSSANAGSSASSGLSIGAGYLVKKYSRSADESAVAENEPSITYTPLETDRYPGMPTEIPPGRPGSLTPDQEAKLKEFWQATLRVFGVLHEPNGSISGTSTPRTAHTSSADLKDEGSGKKKKSRLHLFGKKHHDSEGDADSPAISEDEDKHGQTKEFHKALASQTPEALRAAFWSMVKHDHPDGLLLRFLRARKWDIQNALVMLVSTMHWRSEDMHVDDDIVKRGEEGSLEDAKSSAAATRKEGEDFMSQIRMGKSFLHGVDKDGRPMCFVRVRLHKQGEQSEASLERFTVYTIETARMMLRPPVDTATIVFDMTGFSMANMDYTPVKFMIKCFEANYPESLGSVL
ncbi:hypothetical protein B0A49_09940, partial [Cryomyces minteri]